MYMKNSEPRVVWDAVSHRIFHRYLLGKIDCSYYSVEM
jgi:hypothetical protein